VLIDVSLVLILMPRLLTIAMMASEMPAAIRPYSMAVAADSSARNFHGADYANQKLTRD
jgi:hypothetical protein